MSPARMARVESALRVVLTFHEAFNRHDLDGMLRCLSDDCVFEPAVPGGTRYAKRDAIGQFWRELFRESPEIHADVEELFGSGMRCVLRWRRAWIDAEGQQRQQRGVDLFQVRQDRIYEQISYLKP